MQLKNNRPPGDKDPGRNKFSTIANEGLGSSGAVQVFDGNLLNFPNGFLGSFFPRTAAPAIRPFRPR